MSRKIYVTSDMGLDEALFAVAEENWQAALLWPWILTSLDDWGRGSSDARRIKKAMFPDWPGISGNTIGEAIQLFADHGLLHIYGDSRQYMAASEDAWRKHQTHIRWDRKGKAQSRFPEYPGTSGNVPEYPGKASPSPSLSPSPSNPLPLKRGGKNEDGGIKPAVWSPAHEPFTPPVLPVPTPEEREESARILREARKASGNGKGPEPIGALLPVDEFKDIDFGEEAVGR